jgi:hypothetical protein
VVITDKLASYPPAVRKVLPTAEHRRHKGLNNRAENFTPTDTPARASDASVQVACTSAAVLGTVRRGRRSLSHGPVPHASYRPTPALGGSATYLAGSCWSAVRRLTNALPMWSALTSRRRWEMPPSLA